MQIIDPGHFYVLNQLDDDGTQLLRFVKRVGEGYPGNEGLPYAGVQMQEVLRVLIDRLQYVCLQAEKLEDHASVETDTECIRLLRICLWELETRAARRHGRELHNRPDIEHDPVCDGCGHIGCDRKCDR